MQSSSGVALSRCRNDGVDDPNCVTSKLQQNVVSVLIRLNKCDGDNNIIES